MGEKIEMPGSLSINRLFVRQFDANKSHKHTHVPGNRFRSYTEPENRQRISGAISVFFCPVL